MRKEIVQTALRFVKIRFKSVSRVDYLEPIGAIAGIKGVERKNIPFEGQAFTDEMIVFKNFSDKVLGGLFTSLPSVRH